MGCTAPGRALGLGREVPDMCTIAKSERYTRCNAPKNAVI